MGKPKGTVKPDTKSFRHKGTGSMGSNKLPEPDALTKFVYEGPKREPVPKRDEKPVLGLKSNKNFIISNAVENILSGKGHYFCGNVLYIAQVFERERGKKINSSNKLRNFYIKYIFVAKVNDYFKLLCNKI
jgi:hypothetical protein